MVFMGKLVYLTVFPGFIFILISGTLARGMKEMIPRRPYGQESAFPASSPRSLARLLTRETIAVGGSLHSVLWIAPAVKIFSLSWITCIVFGFVKGDIFLVFTLLLAFSSVDLLTCWLSESVRVRQHCWSRATVIIGWVLPLSLVMSAIALRTADLSIKGIIQWQAGYGSLFISPEGGVLARAGTALALPAAFLCFSTLAGLKPFGSKSFTYEPGDVSADSSGVSLALLCSAETCGFFVMPLLLVALFFAGPASNWLEVLFWVLKVAGAFVLMSMLDYISNRATRSRVFYWMIGFSGSLALAGFVLTWIGVGA